MLSRKKKKLKMKKTKNKSSLKFIPGIFSTFNSYMASMPSFSNKTHFFSKTLFVSNAATGGVITKMELFL